MKKSLIELQDAHTELELRLCGLLREAAHQRNEDVQKMCLNMLCSTADLLEAIDYIEAVLNEMEEKENA